MKLFYEYWKKPKRKFKSTFQKILENKSAYFDEIL